MGGGTHELLFEEIYRLGMWDRARARLRYYGDFVTNASIVRVSSSVFKSPSAGMVVILM